MACFGSTSACCARPAWGYNSSVKAIAMGQAPARNIRLEGWKEIAAYLNRNVRTVQRWEKTESLPVHRHQHQQRAVPYALSGELDDWRRTRVLVPEHRVSLAWLAAGAALVLALGAASAAFVLGRRPSMLTDRDSILIADFRNTTNERVFDGAVSEAVTVGLAQSPFLNIVPNERVRGVLRLMGQSADETLREEQAQEACQRLGAKAFVGGVIAPLGSHYVVAVHVRECRTGESIARDQAAADSREHVLHALSDIVSRLRVRLGESLRSIRSLDVPLEQVTTSSLEALKAFSLGEQRRGGSEPAAIPFYTHAIELDPMFALAYDRLAETYSMVYQPDLAEQCYRKAYELRSRVSERERLNITAHYF